MRRTPAAQLAPWLLLSALGLASSCGTDAKGIEDCRNIEEARCAAAADCGQIDDVAACQRFYRDQCLHGLSVPPPGGPFITACVQSIQDAGACARATGDDIPGACAGFRTQTRACAAVVAPESLSACSFLAPDATPSAEGGGAGAASDPSGSGGMAGMSPIGGEGGTIQSQGGSAGAISSEGGAAPTPSEGGASSTPSEGGGAGAG